MAEIKIEKKKPIWPWILLLIIIALAIVGYVMYEDTNTDDLQDDYNSDDMERSDAADMTDSITYEEAQDFQDSTDVMVQFNESMKDSTRIGTDTTYTKIALVKLARTIAMKADQLNLEPSQAQMDLKLYSGAMDGMDTTSLPKETKLSEDFKIVGTNIVMVMERLQTKNFPTLQKEVADLKQTLTMINAEKVMANKNAAMKTFFKKAHQLINTMNS